MFGVECGKKLALLHSNLMSPIFVAVYLVGAYQGILGDLHNLLVSTNTIHVVCKPEGGFVIDKFIEGESVADVLDYVQFNHKNLVRDIGDMGERFCKRR